MADLPDLDGFEASFRFACAMADEFGISLEGAFPPIPLRPAYLRLAAVDGALVEHGEDQTIKM